MMARNDICDAFALSLTMLATMVANVCTNADCHNAITLMLWHYNIEAIL